MSSRWQAARREILYLALAGMEACFFTPIMLALGNRAARFSPERAAPTFLVLILISFYLVRMLDALKLDQRVQRDIGLIVLVVWVLAVLRLTLYRHVPWYSLTWFSQMAAHLDNRTLWVKDLTLIITTIVFWWRGLELAQRPLDVETVGYSFRAGVLMMAIAVGLASFILEWPPAPLVFTFFFIGLIAVALARAEEVGTWRAGVVFPFNLGWLFSIMGTAAVIIIIALGLISVVTGDSILQTLTLLGPVWKLLGKLLFIVLAVIFNLLYPLLQKLLGGLFEAMAEAGVELPDMVSSEDLLRNAQSPPGFQNLQRYSDLLTGLTVFFLILIAALMFGRMFRARKQLGDIQTDSVGGRQGEGLGSRLQKGLQNLAGRLGILRRWLAANSIRRIYAQMVAAAARRGYPRADSETPYEHLPILSKAWPGMSAQINTITQAYVQTHYGEVAESQKELEAIRTAWEQIQQQ